MVDQPFVPDEVPDNTRRLDPETIIEHELDEEVYQEAAADAAAEAALDEPVSYEELMEEPPAGELGVISDTDVPGEPG
jgi:hypothetical protein